MTIKVVIDPAAFSDELPTPRGECVDDIFSLLEGTNINHDNIHQVLDEFADKVKVITLQMVGIEEVAG
jgi:hypothetical protein